VPPPSPPCAAPSLRRDTVPLLIESSVGERRPKHPRAADGLPTDPSKQLPPVVVTLDHEGEEDPSICTGGGGVIPRSKIAETKPPYVCPGSFIHTYSNNMIKRFHVQ
jgi:hypothetical protein